MSGIDGVGSNNNINNVNNNPKKVENSGNETTSDSIFGDKNNNGIIDKNDFSDAKMAALAEARGLIGKSWDSLKETIDSILNKNQTTPISENAQKAKNSIIEYNKQNNIPYKENPDGSIEVEYNGTKEKYTYSGDTELVEVNCPNGNNIEETYNYAEENGKLESAVITSDNNGIRQVLKYDEAGVPAVQNYKKDENGEFVETDDFMFTTYDNDGGNVYTGADLARMFNSEGFNEESVNEFFRNSYGVNVVNVNLLRDGGSFEVTLQDGTVIYQDKEFMLGDGSISITKPDGTVEKYSRDGERVE